MNKKILIMGLVFLAAVMLANPIVEMAQACTWGKRRKTIETFHLDPANDAPTIMGYTEQIPPTEKYYDLDDGSQIRIAWGALRDMPYAGELGEGVLSVKTILSISKLENVTGGKHVEGSGTYKMTLEITTDNGYGTGTLEGFARLKWDSMAVLPLSNFSYKEGWTMSLQGKGNLKGLTVFVEAYATLVYPYNPPALRYEVWWTTTTIIS